MAHVTAALAALAATSVFLANKHGRHPFGDSSRKAAWWWLALITLDVAVAEAIVTGAFTMTLPDAVDGWGGAARGAAVGVLGPLSLRSPIRETPIRGRPHRVGFTYLYDIARIRLDDGLDERITRLRRSDRQRLERDIAAQGWDAVPLLGLLDEHVREVKRLRPSPTERERIRGTMREAFTIPESGRVQALIKIALDERFAALLDELKSSPPTNENRRCGEQLLARWVPEDGAAPRPQKPL